MISNHFSIFCKISKFHSFFFFHVLSHFSPNWEQPPGCSDWIGQKWRCSEKLHWKWLEACSQDLLISRNMTSKITKQSDYIHERVGPPRTPNLTPTPTFYTSKNRRRVLRTILDLKSLSASLEIFMKFLFGAKHSP